MDHAIDPSVNGSSGHEHREANLRLIIFSAAGLVVVVAIVFLLMWGTFNILKTDQEADVKQFTDLAPNVQVPPEPRLQMHPWEELRQLRTREEKILHTYGWQDQKNGIVRIPIDRAIDIVAQRGLPLSQPGQAAGTTKKTNGPAPNTARSANAVAR